MFCKNSLNFVQLIAHLDDATGLLSRPYDGSHGECLLFDLHAI